MHGLKKALKHHVLLLKSLPGLTLFLGEEKERVSGLDFVYPPCYLQFTRPDTIPLIYHV
jgi:hypothetical protein